MAERQFSRRALTGWAVGGAVLPAATLLSRSAAAGQVSLLVFLHTEIKLKSFESQLAAALPALRVVAVSRYRDFEQLLTGTDAVLALRPVLDQLRLAVSAQGQHQRMNDEPYALVSAGVPIDPKTVATVGALDILGHSGMKKFVSRVSGGAPKVKPVTKVEDLIPLLQLNAVDAVLTPDRFVSRLQSLTQLDLRAVRAGRAGLPALAALTPAGQSVAALLPQAASKLNALIGVTAWT